MDRYTMVVLIVLIVMVATVLRARYASRHRDAESGGLSVPEARRMEEEMRTLKERVAVLERIATDRNHSLEHEIERLRDR